MTCAPLIIAALAAAQPMRSERVDPYLPASLRPVVERAVAAELDPKRGPVNGMAIIEQAQAKYGRRTTEYQALTLRRAAIGLRRIFLTRDEFAEAKRYEQAMATFSRLDLTEPGLVDWLERALTHHEVAREQLGERRIKAGLLLRGAELERATIQKRFVDTFKQAGITLEFVGAKEAEFVLTLATEGVKSPRPDQRAVRAILGIEHIHEGKVEWRTRLFRTMTAPKPADAVTAAVDWLARIGGRDLAFRWMGTHGMPTLIGHGPLGVESHDHHDHH